MKIFLFSVVLLFLCVNLVNTFNDSDRQNVNPSVMDRKCIFTFESVCYVRDNCLLDINKKNFTKEVCNGSFQCLGVTDANLPHFQSQQSTFPSFNFLKGLKWTTSLLIIVICLLSYKKMTCTPLAKRINVFPGDPILPIIGSFYPAFGSPDTLPARFEKVFQRHGRTFRAWILHQPTVVIAEASSVQAIMGEKDHIHKTDMYKSFKWILGNGLTTSEAETWKVDRKQLNPFFKRKRFDVFLSSFNKHGRDLKQMLVELFKEKCEPVNLNPLLCRCSLDFTSDLVLGINTSYKYDAENDFVTLFSLTMEVVKMILFQPWMKLPIIWQHFGMGREETKIVKYAKELFTPYIESRRQIKNSTDHEPNEETNKTIIDVLLDVGRSNEDIVSHLVTFISAGFEPTASAINFTMFLLALNPECQAKVHEELDDIFGSDRNRDVTLDDLSEMKYLEMCVKETIRIFPPVPFTARQIQSDIQLENGLVIPKGCDAFISAYHLHRDPRVFPKPETFDPERFIAKECASRGQYAYMPFAAGPRNCIGQKYAMMEIRTVLAIILRSFQVTTECTRESVKIHFGLVLEAAGEGIQLMLTPRPNNLP